MPETINTHGVICDFGMHKGQLWTRIPVSYLKWLVNSADTFNDRMAKDIAAAELKRRGTVTPTIEVSGHAIDRASLTCRKIWHENRGPVEGLHAWLCRVAQEAITSGTENKGKVEYLGMLFVFKQDGVWPVLKTIMRHKGVKSESST